MEEICLFNFFLIKKWVCYYCKQKKLVVRKMVRNLFLPFYYTLSPMCPIEIGWLLKLLTKKNLNRSFILMIHLIFIFLFIYVFWFNKLGAMCHKCNGWLKISMNRLSPFFFIYLLLLIFYCFILLLLLLLNIIITIFYLSFICFVSVYIVFFSFNYYYYYYLLSWVIIIINYYF